MEKYARDARAFYRWLPEPKQVSKELALQYKQNLVTRYAARSVNSMLAAVNHLLRYLGWDECAVKTLRTQRRSFCAPEQELNKAEDRRLLTAAKKRGNARLMLMMETICSTGIRVSELSYITVEAVARGRAEVGVAPEKVFPHNPRHLFARTFYAVEKDLGRLADLLGHAALLDALDLLFPEKSA